MEARIDGRRVSVNRAEPWEELLTIDGTVSEEGTIGVDFEVTWRGGAGENPSGKRLHMTALAYVGVKDVPSRVHLLERMHLAFLAHDERVPRIHSSLDAR